MSKNKRRTESATGTFGVGSSFIDLDFDKGSVVNWHGMTVSIALEPENADANSNGYVAVWVLPGGVIQNTDLPDGVGQVGNQDFAPYLWGVEMFACSNQTPYHWLFRPKTSRNIQEGGRVVVQIRNNGISAGVLRQNTIITGFETQI